MSTDITTINRQKLVLKHLEAVIDEISYLCDHDSFYNSYINSLCAFSRSLNDIAADLRMINREY